MADAAFFGLFGLTWGTDVTEANKIIVFNELVSLFDSLHDFGSFGSVYDYVTKTGVEFITNKRTIFNHLRNGFSNLNRLTAISTTNSQLHSYSNDFHLKASLSKAKLEDAFYQYAKDILRTNKAIELTEKTLSSKILIDTFGPSIIFSIDTQKKLLASDALDGRTMYQTYDREKRCDPASHTSKYDGGKLGLLIEEIAAGSSRNYLVPGVENAIISGNKIEITNLKINLAGSNDASGVIINNVAANHPNNVTNVNNRLKALIVAAEGAPANINKEPTFSFYTDISGYSGSNSKYIFDVRRKLAQKRLGDQLQVLACMQTISYGGGISVTHPIFVSIDRMAIAFAIANGVNCIYSNADKLTLFKGAANTIVTGKLTQFGGEVVDMPKKNQMGGFREPWYTVEARIKELIRGEPEYLLNYFSYTKALPDGKTDLRKMFNTFLMGIEYTSIDTDIASLYHLRSFTDKGDVRIMHGKEDTTSLVYFENTKDTWSITDNNTDMILTKHNQAANTTLPIKHDVFKGFFEADIESRYNQEGGGKNEGFMKSLALYDILTLFDTEQMKTWYDEFYILENGKAFHSPSFYELNAFFQALFDEQIDYMLIFPFLKNSSDAFSKAVLYAIERILDYMEISVPYDTKVDASSEAVLVSVLERAAEKSKEYGHSISTLKGSILLDYLLEHNLTPLYFYNVFSERYPAKIVSHTKVASKHAISRKRRYNVHIPFERRVLVKAVGGKKKFKGSPRRKTLRKTRRHR